MACLSDRLGVALATLVIGNGIGWYAPEADLRRTVSSFQKRPKLSLPRRGSLDLSGDDLYRQHRALVDLRRRVMWL